MWELGFALPNLELKDAFGNDYIAIVPHTDPRVAEITSRHPVAERFVEGFRNQFGGTVHPSLLITNDTAGGAIRNIDAVVAFRNTVALPVLIEAHELGIDGPHLTHPHYSDYFDLYPISCSRDYSGLVPSSPAVLGFSHEAERFRGQTSPCLAGPKSPSLGLESGLFCTLQRIWIRRFVKRTDASWSNRCLFRSLEMAYEARALPFTNHSTIYDYGSRIGLWVSAFEILSHPRIGKADVMTVINLLGRYNWYNGIIRKRRWRVKYRGRSRGVNLAQRLYKELYDARNDFLHGNPVTMTRLFPFRQKDRPPITSFAPLLYKVALLGFLERLRAPKRKRNLWQDLAWRSANEIGLADQLLRAVR